MALATLNVLGVGNGLIFAFVVALWAAYFVPLAVRRYDEAAKTGTIEKLSPLSRVVKSTVRRETPVEASEAAGPTESASTPRPQVSRAASRLAAKRRRRTLLTLLFVTVVVGALAAFSLIPTWSVAIPVALVVVWLIACRVQVRRVQVRRVQVRRVQVRGVQVRGELGMGTKPIRNSVVVLGSKLKLVTGLGSKLATGLGSTVTSNLRSNLRSKPLEADEEETVILSGQFEDIEPHRKRVMEKAELEADALDQQLVIAVPVATTNGEASWDPLPVTVPTYVTKPRAGRTVRTIDFTEAGTWTSGHVEGEDVELPTRESETPEDERHAVGH